MAKIMQAAKESGIRKTKWVRTKLLAAARARLKRQKKQIR